MYTYDTAGVTFPEDGNRAWAWYGTELVPPLTWKAAANSDAEALRWPGLPTIALLALGQIASGSPRAQEVIARAGGIKVLVEMLTFGTDGGQGTHEADKRPCCNHRV